MVKNPNLYPQFSVHVWEEKQDKDGEWHAYSRQVDVFDNELEAFALYKSINLSNGIVEVDLQRNTEDDYFPIRHKDTSEYGEYIY